MLQLQINIYYEQDNEERIYSGVYTDPDYMIRDVEQQQAQLLKSNLRDNLKLYLDNAYAKVFAIQEQFVEFPSGQKELRDFLEIIFYLSIEKRHPVIAIFLTPIMKKSVFQGLGYWQDIKEDQNNNKNIQLKKNKQKGEDQQKNIDIAFKLQQILDKDYQKTHVIYAVKETPILGDASITNVAILTNFQIKQIDIYSLKSAVETTEYIVSRTNIRYKSWVKNNVIINNLERYENMIQIQNQKNTDNLQYLLVFDNVIPAFQFPLNLRNS